MPLYEYQCKKCHHRFEKIQKFSDKLVKTCPECGGPVEQTISAPAVQFKGSGFYVTDYPKKSAGDSSSGGESSATKADSSKGDSASKGESSKTDTSKSESGAKPESSSKKEDKPRHDSRKTERNRR
jgi:putative FmdB family regulatory protein